MTREVTWTLVLQPGVLRNVEDQALARHAALRLLELRDVHLTYVEAARAETFGGARESRRRDHGRADGQHVRGPRLFGGDVDRLPAPKGREVHPVGIDDEEVRVCGGHGGLEMQAPVHSHGHDLVIERAHGPGQGLATGRVRAVREADEEAPFQGEHVAPVDAGGLLQADDGPVGVEGHGQGGGLAPARRSARPRQDGDLVEHDRDVLDEAAVGQLRVGFELRDAQAEVLQEAHVRAVLGHRPRVVDGLALEEGQLAAGDGGGDASGEGDLPSASWIHHARGRLCLSSAGG